MVGFRDVVRPEAEEAIQQFNRAGIKVWMVTGDNKITARAIAEECGIINANEDSNTVMEGKDFIQMVGGIVCEVCLTKRCDCPNNSIEAKILQRPMRKNTLGNPIAFANFYQKLCVLARTRPQDKLALLIGLKLHGEIVAVTGEGPNDALALQHSEVGFAMGITGTDITKEASSIILLDDNFKSIIKSIIWGRNIYECIQRFLTFHLTVGLSVIGNMFFGAVLIQHAILEPVQLIWVKTRKK